MRPPRTPNLRPAPAPVTPKAEKAETVRSPNKDFLRISGLPAVLALVDKEPDRAERLYFLPGMRGPIAKVTAQLRGAQKPAIQVGPEELERIAGTAMHGGVVVLARPRPIKALTAKQLQIYLQPAHPVLVLDGVGNPQNIGAIARTAAFFGVRTLVLSDHKAQALLSDASYRIAKGGLEHVDVVMVAELGAALLGLKASHQVVGTALGGGAKRLDSFAPDERRPVALVMGNEEVGLPSATLAACETVLLVPGSGAVQSLNVSASAAILIHALLQER